MKSRFLIQLGILWIALGLFLSSPYWIPMLTVSSAAFASSAPDTSQAVNTDKPRISGTPVRIAFPALGIDKSLLAGTFNQKDHSWTLSDNEAQYATMTAESNNQTGNTFVYGHNNMNVFGKLLDAQPGLEAVVTTTNGHVFHYTLVTITDVKPNDLSYLADHQAPILTVQTCSGFWYETRRMFVFNLVEAV